MVWGRWVVLALPDLSEFFFLNCAGLKMHEPRQRKKKRKEKEKEKIS